MCSTVGLSWQLMMVFHEVGHVLQGWLTGARDAAAIFPPFGFSRTEFAVNPHPLPTTWGGAFWGCILPLAILAVARCLVDRKHLYLLTWFAGFCLIANGAYLLGGVFLAGGGDDGSLILQYGGSRWQLVLFSAAALAAGLYSWSGLGPYFGLGPSNGRVSRKAAVGVTIAFVVVAAVEIVIANH